MTFLSETCGFPVWDAHSPLPPLAATADRLTEGIVAEVFLYRGTPLPFAEEPGLIVHTLNPEGLAAWPIDEPDPYNERATFQRIHRPLFGPTGWANFDLLRRALGPVAIAHFRSRGMPDEEISAHVAQLVRPQSDLAAQGITIHAAGREIAALAVSLDTDAWAIGSCDISCPVSISVWRHEVPQLVPAAAEWSLSFPK